MSVKLYVGNLDYHVDNGELATLFNEHGEVERAEVVTDRSTGRSKGFGFVYVADEEGARKAIEAMDGHEAFGRSLRVNEARGETRVARTGGSSAVSDRFLRKYKPDDIPTGYVPRQPKQKRRGRG